MIILYNLQLELNKTLFLVIQVTYGGSCTYIPNQCSTVQLLTCISNVCTCNSATEAWSTTYSKCGNKNRIIFTFLENSCDYWLLIFWKLNLTVGHVQSRRIAMRHQILGVTVAFANAFQRITFGILLDIFVVIINCFSFCNFIKKILHTIPFRLKLSWL